MPRARNPVRSPGSLRPARGGPWRTSFSPILARHRASNRLGTALRAKDTRFIPLRTLTTARPRRSEAFLNSTSSSPSGARVRTGMTALSQSRRRPHGWRGSYRSGLGGSQPMPCRNRSVDRLRCWSLTATGLPPASLRYRKALAGRFSPPIRPERAMGRWRHQTPRPTALTRYSLQRPKEQSQPPSQATSTQSAVEAEAGRLVHKIRPNVGRRAGARGSPPWP
jgi:hypothetical protein